MIRFVLALMLAMEPRRWGKVDMGAYEHQNQCFANVVDVNGEDAVGVPDLLAVINNWGPCGGHPNTDAPTTVQECMTFCGNQFGFGTPEYQSCLEKCCSTLDQ